MGGIKDDKYLIRAGARRIAAIFVIYWGRGFEVDENVAPPNLS